MPDLSRQLEIQAQQNAAGQRRERESRIARGVPFEDNFQTAIELAEQERQEDLERANREAEAAQRQRAEDEREIAIDRQAERCESELQRLNQQAFQVVWAARLQNPHLPSGPQVPQLIINELEEMQAPELSIGSVLNAYQRLFDKGVLKPNYSKAAREKAISEAESWREQGHQIPVEYEQDPETLTEQQSRELMRKLQPVSVTQMRHLTDRLDEYREYRGKKSPAPVGDDSLSRRAAKVRL